jgi:hypothetical protein
VEKEKQSRVRDVYAGLGKQESIMSIQSDLLKEVSEIVSGARNKDYGPPSVNLDERTARLWTAYLYAIRSKHNYLEIDLNGVDVCNMMILLKIARTIEDATVKDNYADIAGYAGAAWEIVHG